jgi:hypothetical protein
MKRSIVLSALSLMLATAAFGAAPLSGRVSFQKNGAPVSQALVDFISQSRRVRAVTVDDGSYYVPDLPKGLYNITITYRKKKYYLKRFNPRLSSHFTISK